MTEHQIALARRAVACRGWRWMPGMRAALSSGLVVRLGDHDEGSLWRAILAGGATCTVDVRHPWYTVAPDLTDPATVGCLLALVREAWGDKRTAVKWWYPEGCAYYTHPLDDSLQPRELFESEAEALVAALEAAP